LLLAKQHETIQGLSCGITAGFDCGIMPTLLRLDCRLNSSSHRTTCGVTADLSDLYTAHPICGIDVFNKVVDKKRNRIKASLACIYDCIQVASDNIQNSIGWPPLCNYKPRDDVYGSTLQNFMVTKVMRNELITLQVKCLSLRYQTDRHKDSKNCCWLCHDKTGGLCFIIVDCFGTYWSLKFLSNSRHVIGSYFDKLLGVMTLHLSKKSFRKT
jgi:hypothetical protein